MEEFVKIVVYVPEKQVELIRETLAKEGAGKIGNYDSCCFVCEGTGYWRPLEGSNPAVGEKNKVSKEKEFRIEAVCRKKDFEKIIKKIKEVHEYEEPAIDVFPLLNKI